MRGVFCLCGLLLGTASCTQAPAAAPPFPISTDRPSVSATPTLVPTGRLLIESGASTGGAGEVSFVQGAELVLRRGISPRLEVDIVAPNYREERDDAAAAGAQTQRGFGDPALALRVGLVAPRDDAALVPALSLLAASTLPTAGTFAADRAIPSATLIAAWALPRGLAVGANAGLSALATSETQSRASGILSGPLGARGALFAELASAGVGGRWDPALLSLGATWLLQPRVQLDLVHRRQGARGGYREFGAGFSISR